jgi:DNA (cytosine-5)-methyltransferase 1
MFSAPKPIFFFLSFKRHLFFTDEIREVPLHDVLAPCYVLHHNLIFDMELWAALGPSYFYYKYRFPRCHPASWNERELLEEGAGFGCETCAFVLQDRLAEVVSFNEEVDVHKLRAFDVFSGAGAMSLGMESAGSMKTTHAVEIAPSAARTFRCVQDMSSCAIWRHRQRECNDGVSFLLGATPRVRSSTTSA